MRLVYVDDVADYAAVVRCACASMEKWLKRPVTCHFVTLGKNTSGLLWLKDGRECTAADIHKELVGTRCVPSKADIEETLSHPDTIYLLDLEFHPVYLKAYGLDLGLYLVSRGVSRDRIVLFTAWAGRVFQRFKEEVSKGPAKPCVSFFPYEKEALAGDPESMGERLAWKLIELRPPVLLEPGKTSPKAAAAEGFPEVIGESNQLRKVIEQCRNVAVIDRPVLITGESGTGKEFLVARLIHRLSSRSTSPFVAVNCAALPEHLAESELFGYEKGAFTGAAQPTPGHIESAHGGVLFLDEIGDLSLANQAKLVRVLQDHRVTRLGSRRGRSIDFLLLSATNKDLKALCNANLFRPDLFYRISVAEIAIPPLRERPADILPLARHFLVKASPAQTRQFAPDTERLLLEAKWEGNARELDNAIVRAVLLTSQVTIPPSVMRDAIGAVRLDRTAAANRTPTEGWAPWLAAAGELKARMGINRNLMSAFSAALRNLPDGELRCTDESVRLIWDVLVAAVRQMCERRDDVRRSRMKGDYGLPIFKLATLLGSLDLGQSAQEALSDAVKYPLPNWSDFEYSGEANPREWESDKKKRVIRVIETMAAVTRGR